MNNLRNSPSGKATTPRWVNVAGTVVRVGAGATEFTLQTYRDTPYLMYFARSDQNDEGHFRFEMPENWSLGEVSPFVRVIGMAASSGSVVFSGLYAWASPGNTLPPLSGWTSFKKVTAFSSSDQYKEKRITLFSTIPPAVNRSSGAVLAAYVVRAGSDPDDTYKGNNPYGNVKANLGFAYSGFSCQVSGFGSLDFPK